MKKELVREEKMTDQVKQLAQQVITVIDNSNDSPENRLRVIKSYMLGLIDGISITEDTELDTCTKCGKKTGKASYAPGHPGLYCPECSAELCRKSEGPSEQPAVKRPRIDEFPNPNKSPKCSICGSSSDLMQVLFDNKVVGICDRCRKALMDPKSQEALHKG